MLLQVKIWHLSVDASVDPVCNPSATLNIGDTAVELVLWNPIAENVLAATSQQSIRVYDVKRQIARIGIFMHLSGIALWHCDHLSGKPGKPRNVREFETC